MKKIFTFAISALILSLFIFLPATQAAAPSIIPAYELPEKPTHIQHKAQTPFGAVDIEEKEIEQYAEHTAVAKYSYFFFKSLDNKADILYVTIKIYNASKKTFSILYSIKILVNLDNDKDFEIAAIDNINTKNEREPDKKWDNETTFFNENLQIKYEQFSFLKDK